MPTNDDYNAYLNFVLYAVYGMMGDADTIMRRDAERVRRVAKELRRSLPTPPTSKTLWRGILIEQAHLEFRDDGIWLKPDPRLRFTSWSTDKSVACWFGRRDTFVSQFVAQQRPDVQGYMMKTKAGRETVLWSHEWDIIPTPRGPISLRVAAEFHPLINPDQFQWNVEKQREVITEPIAKTEQITPIGEVKCPTARVLDAKLTPPGVRH